MALIKDIEWHNRVINLKLVVEKKKKMYTTNDLFHQKY